MITNDMLIDEDKPTKTRFICMIYTERQRDRETDRQTGRQADRQTERETAASTSEKVSNTGFTQSNLSECPTGLASITL